MAAKFFDVEPVILPVRLRFIVLFSFCDFCRILKGSFYE